MSTTKKPSFAEKYPFYMTHSTACELLAESRRRTEEKRAKRVQQFVKDHAAEIFIAAMFSSRNTHLLKGLR